MADITNSIMPASGWHDRNDNNWFEELSIPQSISTGGWTKGSEGYDQQTFLGASIQSFTMNAGFGDTASTLSTSLVVDEFNESDGKGHGQGWDVYHNGKRDIFAPPYVGSPVFFTFGKFASEVKDAFKEHIKALVYNQKKDCSINEYYNAEEDEEESSSEEEEEVPTDIPSITTIPKNQYWDVKDKEFVTLKDYDKRPKCALTFGGILQSYTQTRGINGNPLYSVQVVDPREILGNVKVILNNYAESIYDDANIINVYGFLEHNPSKKLEEYLDGKYDERSIIKRSVDNEGKITFTGSDAYTGNADAGAGYGSLPPTFPITGTGFSRRSDQGIPFYRVNQALSALMQYGGKLPDEYKKTSYFRKINFRGFNYIVDLTGLPALPDFYYLDFDEMSLLELVLEVCDVTNRDLYVSLLPVLDMGVKTEKETEGMSEEEKAEEKLLQKLYGDTPYAGFLYKRNEAIMEGKNVNETEDNERDGTTDEAVPPATKENDFIAGIIRCDAIDRSKQPEIGAVKEYLDELQDNEIYVKNRDVGYEVSNVVTNKIIAGAQETNMYLFSSYEDRRQEELSGKQYDLEEMLGEQIIPYYGMLGKNVVTIPKGHGAYQQILLDTRSLNANGVRSYYVATELEIRSAMISFEKWSEFLMEYNDRYMESIEENDVIEGNALAEGTFETEEEALDNMINLSNNYAVTVPRSVWPCMEFQDKPEFQFENSDGEEGGRVPKSACNPPYGYPLYYQRATQIGLPQAGLMQINYAWNSQIMPAIAEFKNSKNKDAFKAKMGNIYSQVKEAFGIDKLDEDADDSNKSTAGKILRFIETSMEKVYDKGYDAAMSFVSDSIVDVAKEMSALPRLARRGTENARRIHAFLKNVGSENLGKKFLVRIPSRVNFNWQQSIEATLPPELDVQYTKGPFGFRPLPKDSGNNREFDTEFKAKVKEYAAEETGGMSEFLYYGNNQDRHTEFNGALNLHYNPFSDQLETNYVVDNQGGFFDFDLYQDLLDNNGIVKALKAGGTDHKGVVQQLIPVQLDQFIQENGRVSAYVRFNDSQQLDFNGLSASDFVQDTITDSGQVPDVAYNLDNLNEDNTAFTRFYNQDDEDENDDEVPLKRTVGFVKCSVDERIYYSPPVRKTTINVYGREVIDKPFITLPKQVVDTNSEDQEIKYTQGFVRSNFIPKGQDGDTYRTYIMDFRRHVEKTPKFNTDEEDTNVTFSGIVNDKVNDFSVTTRGKAIFGGDHEFELVNAYALITLPGRIAPTKDARFRDGPHQLFKPESIKHYLSMDVVKGVDGFDQPALVGEPTTFLKDNEEELCTTTKFQKAKEAYRVALKSLEFCTANSISLAMPSPVYPDLVALPLRSKERFYGPWRSSVIDPNLDNNAGEINVQKERYKDIGGAIEFVKDETLAPWNYFGYGKMNEAGKVRATFANAVLLLSERGGFVTDGAPTGVSLAVELKERGPLVTNISVDVSTAGITTTTQLDLYTVSFGKLQKQKEQELSRSSRERKKLSDERNALIRRGIGKSQTDQSYKVLYRDLEDKLKVFEDTLVRSQQDEKPPTDIVATVSSRVEKRYAPNNNNEHVNTTKRSVNVAVQKTSEMGKAASNFPTAMDASQSYYNSAGGGFEKVLTPASMDPQHPNMPSKFSGYLEAREELHSEQDTFDVTLYED